MATVQEQLKAVWRQAGGFASGLTMFWEPLRELQEAAPDVAAHSGAESGAESGADVSVATEGIEAAELLAASELTRRKTLSVPSILSPFGSGFGAGVRGDSEA